MKIEILRQTVCDGKRVNVGDVVNITDTEGRFLVAIKKAKKLEEKPRQRTAKSKSDNK